MPTTGRPPTSVPIQKARLQQVEELMCLGYSDQEIARRLNRHVRTIWRLVSDIYGDYGINADKRVSRRVVSVLSYLIDHGHLDPESLKVIESNVVSPPNI